MIQLGAPGVYIVEASSGLRPITGVATSIAAFIDWFPQGPDTEATQIFGLSDFERLFGGINTNSEASYAINQFFLNGGSSCWVVRASGDGVAADAASAATANLFDGSSTPHLAVTASGANAGAWTNGVRLSVTPNADGSFNLAAARYDASGRAIASESYLSLSATAGTSNYFVDSVNADSNLVELVAASATALAPAATGTLSDAITLPVGVFNSTPHTFTAQLVSASNATLDARPVSVVLAGVTDLRGLRAAVQGAIRAAKGTSNNPQYDAAFAGITVDVVGTRLYFRTNRQAKTYDPLERLQFVASSPADSFFAVLTDATKAVVNVQEYPLGNTTTVAAFQGGTAGSDGTQPNADSLNAAMDQLDKVDLFNMLLIPRMAELPDADQVAVVSKALTYCESRRAILFVDIPKTVNTPQKVDDWLDAHDEFRDNNSVIYFPRVQVPDPANNYRLRSIAPSGTLAGIFSRTDTDRGVWKAPAGIDAVLRNVVQLDYKMNDGENGVLNPLAINCLRVFPVYGEVAWGARTLEGADAIGSEWKYIPVRRLALMIEESLFRGTKWVVFEPNDEPLWAKIRQNVGAFMLGLFRQGAFQGGTPSDAYFVKCDAETTTAQDRSNGVVNIKVGFAPLKPAEFVVITIQQIPDLS
jgi:uncharacterized protein